MERSRRDIIGELLSNCLEIYNDPEIQKILNDISEIMDTKMILGANPDSEDDNYSGDWIEG